jgi:hypothetical protein
VLKAVLLLGSVDDPISGKAAATAVGEKRLVVGVMAAFILVVVLWSGNVVGSLLILSPGPAIAIVPLPPAVDDIQ